MNKYSEIDRAVVRPVAAIAEYMKYDNPNTWNDTVIIENRLMWAYTNGWAVNIIKRYLVNNGSSLFCKKSHNSKLDYKYAKLDLSPEAVHDFLFTESEIKELGLQGHHKMEVNYGTKED